MTGTTPFHPREKSRRQGATRLTMARLRAIEEALIFRLAGEIEDGDEAISTADYEAALRWATAQIARRDR